MQNFLPGWLTLLALVCLAQAEPAKHPNILWITSEDNGPHLGCYGDAYAITPNLDALAQKGMRYAHVWSVAPVCAPARTAIISGLYPSSTGAEHMRSLVPLPANMRMYPQFLREAGYYCSNNNKEDYNLEKPGRVWDDSSAKAHWKNRKPGQPFFAIFNHTITHESQIRRHDAPLRHDPAKVRVPAYHPDTPEVRRDWARYYDRITEMDALAGRNLQELAAAGLAEDTIVFYYGDHGPGLPRCKRYPYNSGLQAPLIIYVPEKFKHLAPKDYQAGSKSERLVSFVDLAPTVLSLAGIKPPEWMQGGAIMGPFATPAPDYLHGLRGRMDERYDLVRSVRDNRYVYIRNYMPHEIYGQYVGYMFQTPTTKVWQRLYQEGKLTPAQARFWETKPIEELYDLQTDPDEVTNLASSSEHRPVLERLRAAQQQQIRRVRDVGFLPEGEIHSRAEKGAPYTMGHDPVQYPLEDVVAAAELASNLSPEATPRLLERLNHPDSAVRFWASLGLLMRGEKVVKTHGTNLHAALHDSSAYVRINAAEALIRHGNSDDRRASLSVLLEHRNAEKSGFYTTMWALNALEAVRSKADLTGVDFSSLPRKDKNVNARTAEYVGRLLNSLAGAPDQE